MKKLTGLFCAVVFLFASNGGADTVYLGIDDSLNLAAIDGFQFDISGGGGNVLTTYNTDVTDVAGTGLGGAITMYLGAFDNWLVEATPNGYVGYDRYLDNPNPGPLVAGMILSVYSDEDLSLENFVLASSWNVSGNYEEGPWTVVESSIAGGTLYTMAAVPIHSAIPTVSEWGMIILYILLVGSALWVIRQKTRYGSV